MRRYALVVGGLLALLLGLFAVAEALSLPLLTDPSPWLDVGGIVAGVVGVALLVVDVALPVPSSVVMMTHGALFGVALGTLLSLVGSVGAALVGFGIGRRGGPLLARLVPPGERAQADALLQRYGVLAVIVTRPVPLLAETVAVLAGASPMTWSQVTAATVAGALPAAALFALAGAVAASFANLVVVFGLVLLVAAVAWTLGRAVGAHWAVGT